MLIIALVAVIGFAAFSTSPGDGEAGGESDSSPTTTVSARVASAILALRVSDADARISEPSSETTTSTTSVEGTPQADDAADVTAQDEPATTAAPGTTSAPPTTTARDTTPPDLHVDSPSDGAKVEDRVVTFSGTSEAGAKVYSGPYDAAVDDDGNWTLRLVVSSEGSNAKITAEDTAGNTATVSILVTYSPPPPPPTTTTTTKGTTTTTSGGTNWSPNWPADAAGKRHVEYWRPLVEKYWPDYLVNCALNIIHFESYGNPQAYNRTAHAEGLFQHLSKYWKARAAAAGFRDSNGLYATPYNAEANIAVSWYLAKNSSPWDRHWSVDPQHPNAPFECTE
jgi:hypothetical protein